MSPVGIGALIGIALAFAALAFGFWGIVLVVLCGAIGAVTAAAVSGRLDLRAMLDAARGRRVA